MSLISPQHIQDLVPYVPGKPIEETQRELGLKRIVKLASNENPLGPSPKAMLALKKNLPVLHLYPDARHYQFRKALGEFLDLDSERVVVGNGSDNVIEVLVRAFTTAGDAILTHQTAFIAYQVCAQVQGLQAVLAPVDAQFKPDLSKMLAELRKNPKIKLVFIANPNNPTGTYVPSAELKSFVAEALRARSDLLVVVDTAYQEYITAKGAEDPIDWLEDFDRLVVLRTFSKIYGLAGLRVGYGVSSPEIVATLQKVKQPFNVNSVALWAAEAALKDQAFVKKARALNQKGMKFWEDQLADWGVPYWPSQGNFLLLDTKRGFGCTGIELFQKALKGGVILRPVTNYGLPDAIRMSIGTPEENKFAAKVLSGILSEGRTH